MELQEQMELQELMVRPALQVPTERSVPKARWVLPGPKVPQVLQVQAAPPTGRLS